MFCVLLGCLFIAPVARAGWLGPVEISSSGEHIGTPRVVLDSAGNATAVWDRWDGSDTVVESAYRPAGEGWQAPLNLSGTRASDDEAPSGAYDAGGARIAVDASGDTTVVWERYAGVNKILIQAIYRPAGGSWGPPIDIGEVKTMVAPEPWIAVDSGGGATAVWKGGEVIWSAYRPAAGNWQPPEEISPGDSYTPQAAVDAQGDATAVWMHYDGSDYVVQSAYRPAGGSWESPKLVSGAGEEAGNPQIALDASGDAIVAWRGEDGGEEAARSSRRPKNGDWEPPVDISTPGEAVQALQIALDPGGDALAAWSGSTNEIGKYGIAKSAYQPQGGQWEESVELSEDGGNAFPLDLVFDGSGNAAIAWERSDGSHNVLQAAYRPAEADWQAATDLSEEGGDAMDAQLVLDAPGDEAVADGDATAIWTRLESISCEEPPCYSYTVQAAGYDTYDSPPDNIEVPPTGTAGEPVEISVPPADIWSPLMDFGDGSSAASTSASHVYEEPGKYTVTFASTNVLGYRESAQRTITVGNGGGLPESGDEAAGSSPGPTGSGEIKAVQPNPPSGPSAACTAAKRARTSARQRLARTRSRLGHNEPGVDGVKLRHTAKRQEAALRRAGRAVLRACT